jgi:hypothetical protein
MKSIVKKAPQSEPAEKKKLPAGSFLNLKNE